MSEHYNIYIFVDGSEELVDKVKILKDECKLIKKFTVWDLDIDSVEAFKPKIQYYCSKAGLVAVTDKYCRFIVRLGRIPRSFFELRSWLLELGYRQEAKAIQWETETV